MSAKSKTMPKTAKGIKGSKSEVAKFFGKMVAFNTSLKLYHWHVTGVGSYAKHMALDQCVDTARDVTDRVVETIYSMAGDIEIVVPETKVPTDIIKHAADFYAEVEESRACFTEAFTQSIIDDYQEAIQQLLYRLRRLQ